MSKTNIVLEGKYKDEKISATNYLRLANVISGEYITKQTISSYTVIDETNKDKYSYWKGALGVALLGGLGAVAGIGGKKKFSKEYLIAIEWKSGEKSLILIDDDYYKIFMKSMF